MNFVLRHSPILEKHSFLKACKLSPKLLHHIAEEINHVGAQISSGVVLTGGSSMIRGTVEIAEQVFDAPTRIGFPEKKLFGGLIDAIQSPEWAT